MPWPFELTPDELDARLDEMVNETFAALQSQFLVMERGKHFIEYVDFNAAYEVLRTQTNGFQNFDEHTVWLACLEDSLALVVVRSILGFTPPEWASLAAVERGADIDQGKARKLDVRVRHERNYLASLNPARADHARIISRVKALVSVAAEYIRRGAEETGETTIHRLAKADTLQGVTSVQYLALHDVPYAMLLYERFIGRPFAGHKDSISGLVGAVMENAVEERVRNARVPIRKTGQAEKIAGFDQAPDFIVPDEYAPSVIIEAKITSDDGTARDKATRILHLAHMRDELIRSGRTEDEVFEVVACIDGRGFGIRKQDMRNMLRATKGKIFTLATLDHLITHTRIRKFVPTEPQPEESARLDELDDEAPTDRL